MFVNYTTANFSGESPIPMIRGRAQRSSKTASSLPPSEYTGPLLPTPPQNSSFFQPSEPRATNLQDIESADSSCNVVEPPSEVTRDWLVQTAASSQRLKLTAIAMGRCSYFCPMAQMSHSQSLMISLCHTHHLQLP